MIYWIIAIILAIAIVFGITRIARYFEAKSFNNGICPLCNSKLRNFDTDSQGGRGYACTGKGCEYTTWCSYNVDKNFVE